MKKWKRLKRIVAFTLAVILAGTTVDLSTFAVSAAEGLGEAACAESGCTGTYSNGFCSANSTHYQAAVLIADSYYGISNAGQLYWFAEHVNTAVANSGDNAILTKDIVVNEKVLNADGTLVSNSGSLRTWTPVGTEAYPYGGTFHGNGFSISGLYCVQPEEGGEAGLFAYIQRANLSDIIILDSRFAAEEEGGIAGAIAAVSAGSLIQDCYSEASVTAGHIAGGIVGTSLEDTLIRCGNAGTVTASGELDYLGGVLGATRSIYGRNVTSKVTSCFNIGTVVNAAGDAFYTGALVGYPEWLFLYGSYYDSSKCSKATGNTADYTNRTEFEDCTIDDVTAKEDSDFASGAVCELIGHPVSTWTYTAGEHTALCIVCGAVEQKDHHNLHSSCDNGGDCTVCGYTIQPGAHYYSDDTCLICNWPCPGHTFGDDNNCTICEHQLVPVTDIQFERHNASQTAVQGEKLNLTSGVTVLSENADFKQVTWYKVDGTEETAIATTDYASYSAAEAGTLKLRAKIENGAGMGTAYVKDFTFTITPISYEYDILESSVVISSADGSNIRITYNGKEVVVSNDTAIRVYGDGETVTANNITIEEGASVNLILDNCIITGADTKPVSPIEIASGASASIMLVGSNQLTGGYIMPGIYVPQGAAVIIGGTGSLDVAGNEVGSAAIGGAAKTGRKSSGSITINSGTIHAESAGANAAIGAGLGGDMGDITINGGNITAVNTASSAGGAGIGVAYNSKTLGKITITGGNITSKGGGDAVGIGSGATQTAPDIVITGGTIQATGKDTYGIGPGLNGTGSTVTITGGNVSGSVRGTVNNGSTSLYTITLKTVNNASVGTPVTGLTAGQSAIEYKLKDVVPINNTLYFYLPSGSQPTSVVSDGVKYIGTVTNNAGTFVYEHTCVATVTEATCKNLAVCDVCGLPVGDLNPDNHESDSYTYTAHETFPAVLHIVKHACCSAVKETVPHTKKNGICTDCGYKEQPKIAADGTYQISNAGELLWFRDYLEDSKDNLTANAKLTADIDMTGTEWRTPARTQSYVNTTTYDAGTGYQGTFDGNGHVISNITIKQNGIIDNTTQLGLFGTLSGTVKNLGMENVTVDQTGAQYAKGGAIISQIIAKGEVSDCFVNKITFKGSPSGTPTIGGIAANNFGGTIRNCYVAGYTAGIMDFPAIAENNTGLEANSARRGTIVNCYTDYGRLIHNKYPGTVTESISGVSAERFASGEITYKLNGSKSDDSVVWHQTVSGEGAQAYPGFTGGTVYKVICGEAGNYIYSNENVNYDSHDFDGGICSRCGAADLTADENGIYQIYTAEDLMLFAKFVNNGNTTANAKLMADINLEGYDWKPIGTYSDSDTFANAAYSGTFDGNYHVIKNLSVKVETAHETGLFGRVNGGGTIKNLGVVDATVENTQGIRAGVIAGEIHNSTVTNVFTAGNITVTTSNANGQAGGIAGECANSVLANCYTTYGYLTSNVGTLNNCYYMADAANSASKGTNLPESSFISGELTYILNGRIAEGVWKQTLDTDEYPGFTGETVYAVSETCDESTITSYSNSADEVIPHSFGKDGICTVCGAFEPAKYVNGVYEISIVGQYMWFAKLVNAGNTAANAKLTADIGMTDYQATYGNVMIGTSTMKYSGTFDGSGKTLTVNLNSTEQYTAPFRYINGATIQNLTVNGTISTNQKFAAGLVGYSEGASRIEKCMVAVTMNSSVSGDGTHGGLVANVNSGSLTIGNCGFVGTINGANTTSCGGFVGWANGTTTISNSYVSGTFTTKTDSCYTFGRNPSKYTITNSYYVTAYGTDNSGATQMTQAQFESGEVTYKLNNGVTDGTQAWGQTLTGDGADAYPVLGGDKVYYGYVSCTAAEKVYTNDSNASDTKVHTDADGDGKCDVETCGEFMDGIGARLVGYTLSLDGNIGVNFYMELDEDVATDTSAYMLFTLPGGGTQTVLVSQATKNTTLTAGKTYYVFSCKVAAKEMTDTIKAQMICSDGNGGTKAGTEYTYSVRAYAEALLGRAGATEKEIALAKAMLNYGAYAQTYFNYKTDTLANVGYEDNALTISGDAMTTLKNYVPEVNVTEGSVLTYAGSTIRLESELKVRHYFKLAEGATEPSRLTLYVPPTEYADKITDTYYYYESDGIAFGSWGTKTAYSEVAGNTITYCPLSYVTTVVATKADSDLSGETSLQNLMKALYLYYQSVVSYNAN